MGHVHWQIDLGFHAIMFATRAPALGASSVRCALSSGLRTAPSLLRRLCAAPPLPPTAVSRGAPRHAALLAAIKQLEGSFGKHAVMRLGERPAATNIDVISTGSIALDHALGVGGLPKGRVVEIYGQESSGKTTLALHVIAEAQRAGLSCVFIDAEHAIDPAYAKGLGVDLDSLYLAQPDSGEQALEIADTLIRSGGIDVVVVDSVAALVPRAEIAGEMGDAHMALQARLMSQALRKLTSSLSKARTLIIFINQIRSKVGVIFGSPDVTSGGNALKFYASVRLEIRKTGIVKGLGAGEDAVGNTVRVKVAKNKLAPPFRTADFELTYGRGINRAAEVVDLALLHGLLAKGGAWIRCDDEKLVAAMNAALAKEAAAGAAAGAVVAPAEAAAAAPVAAAAAKRKKGDKSVPAAAAPAMVEESAPSSDFLVLAVGEPFAQGRERAKAFIEAHPGVADVLRAAVRQALAEKPAPPGPSPPPALSDDVFAPQPQEALGLS